MCSRAIKRSHMISLGDQKQKSNLFCARCLEELQTVYTAGKIS